MLAHYSTSPSSIFLLPAPLANLYSPRSTTHNGLQLSATWQRAVLKGNASLNATMWKLTRTGWVGWYGSCNCWAGAPARVRSLPRNVWRCAMARWKKAKTNNLTLHLIAIYCKIAHAAGCFPAGSLYFAAQFGALFFGLLTYTVMHFWLCPGNRRNWSPDSGVSIS